MSSKSSRLSASIAAAACLFVRTAPGAPIHTQSGTEVIFFAVDYTSIANPDSANDVQDSAQTGSAESPARVWSAESSGTSLAGSVLRAPSSPHRQQTSPASLSLHESVVTYEVSFTSAGSYKLYVRAGNNGTSGNQSSDSIWIPSSFAASSNPTSQFTVPSTGALEWKDSSTFTVAAGDVGDTLTFTVGVREQDARIDAFVFSTQTSLTSTQLDALFGSSPTPIPTPTPTPPPVGENETYVCSVGEFDDALQEAEPGDTIIMCNGTWNNATLTFNGKLSANNSGGTSVAPITLKAETGGQVNLTGSSKLIIAGQYMVVDGLRFNSGSISGGGTVIIFRTSSSNEAQHCRITNCAIESYNPSSSSTDYDWVGVFGSNNRIDHCMFSGMNHSGVTVVVWLKSGGPASAVQMDYNYFVDRALGSTGNGFETIRIGDSGTSLESANAIVEYNLFERCDGEIETISNKSVGNTYRYNTFRENNGELTLRHGSACTVDGNFFFGEGKSGSGGVRVIGPDHVVKNNYFQDLKGTELRAAVCLMNGVPSSPLNRYRQAVNNTIAFNTIVNCKEAFSVGTESSEGDTTLVPDQNTFANNVIYTASTSNTMIHYYNTPTNMTYEGNFAYGKTLEITNPGGISTSNPLMSLGSDGWYHPGTSSPVIGAAQGSYPTITLDIEGQTRDASPDSGADEVLTGSAPRRPLTEDDVGPEWMHPGLAVTFDSWRID